MYQIESSGQALKSKKGPLRPRLSLAHVSSNVLFLGFTSLFTDVSSEMISTILPVYLIFTLHLPPLQFGIVDGLYQGAAALLRVFSGLIADRWRRYKEVAAAGYALSAVCKLGLLLAGNVWAAIAGVILLDRVGKGIRTAPRDALISLSSSRANLATAFGVHRALDTAGAMLGPLVAFGLLTLLPGAFDVVFVVSFCAALVGLGVLILFVENRTVARPIEAGPEAVKSVEAETVGNSAVSLESETDSAEAETEAHNAVSLKNVAGLMRMPGFRVLVFVGAILSLATMSEAFLYLGMQRRLNFSVGYFPLLYVATALIYLVLAVPVGRLADRIGRAAVFVSGYVLLLLVYTSLLAPGVGLFKVFVYLLMLGAYYAATDGVLMALASAQLPQELRASGLALLTTATGLARLFASILFGFLWTLWGVEMAVLSFVVALAVTTLIAATALARVQRKTKSVV